MRFDTQEILTRIRPKREALFNYAIQNGVMLAPYWSPEQRFIEPPVIDDDAGRYARVVVVILALEHPSVLADDWGVVQTGLFNWSSDIAIVSKPGDLGFLPHVKHRKRDGSSWVLVETDNPIDWQRWRYWPKLVCRQGKPWQRSTP